jgi:hypothetical protein
MTAKYLETAKAIMERAAQGADPLTAYLAREQAQRLVDHAAAIGDALGNMPRGLPVTLEPFTYGPEAVGFNFADRDHVRRYVELAGPTPKLHLK